MPESVARAIDAHWSRPMVWRAYRPDGSACYLGAEGEDYNQVRRKFPQPWIRVKLAFVEQTKVDYHQVQR